MQEWELWLVTAMAFAGAILNLKKQRSCFLIWMMSNIVFVIHNILIREWPQAALFTAFFGLAIWGWFSWSRELKHLEVKSCPLSANHKKDGCMPISQKWRRNGKRTLPKVRSFRRR